MVSDWLHLDHGLLVLLLYWHRPYQLQLMHEHMDQAYTAVLP
jgi:hypothetical protein